MIDPRLLENEKRLHIALKERLRADDPTLDEITLADTVEGLTDFHETLATVVRSALTDEAMAEGLGDLIDEMVQRRVRLQARGQRRREIVRDAMLDADLAKLTMPDFTATVREAPPHVVVIDEAIIPQDYIINKPTVNKRAILNALKEGEAVEGAALSNKAMTLSVRTR